MLGIRRQGGVAIDLFQGDASLFAADAQVGSVSDLAVADSRGARHVAIVGASVVAEIGNLKVFLGRAMKLKSLRRVTFLLADSDQYYAFQDELFRLFPEDG